MARTLRLRKEKLENTGTVYAVVDKSERMIGYVARGLKHQVKGTKAKSIPAWGYALVSSEFKNGIHYQWETREEAIEALAKLRSVKVDTTSIAVIKK